MDQSSRSENLIIFIILMLMSVVLMFGAFSIPAGGELGVGASFLPKIISVALGLCAIGFLVQFLRMEREKDQLKKINKNAVLRFFLSLGLLIMYASLLKPIGYMIMTVVYIFLQSQLMIPNEKRNILLAAIISIVVAVLIYFIFNKGFNIMLPPGLLK
jgi:putative tricarboxylic transport membrane protein